MKRARRDRLRALTSEILPYEVPLPFDVTRLYEFLRKLDFKWEGALKFSILDSKCSPSALLWLALVFDPVPIGPGALRGSTGDKYRRRDFNLAAGKSKADLRHPYKFRAMRNNGKSRSLAIPHPHSMVQMASFVHDYRDSILYFTNRSNFSIRYPHRVARLQSRRESVFDGALDKEAYGVEQSDLEYSHVSSFFSYKAFNNINRFYASSEFQAYERKYPRLIRADVAKCFDSVYTHTISWVTNGLHASKNSKETAQTFGGSFDRLMQYLNYAETSGIVIGPELSRVFAEIILQEVDLRIEKELASAGLRRTADFEIMRYVDDYFIFLADATHTELVEETLSTQLGVFKLHLNDEKQLRLDTPLGSHMSIAKVRIKEELERRTLFEVDRDANPISLQLQFSARQSILDYKALLIDVGLNHGDLANSYLYELGRRQDQTVRQLRGVLRVAAIDGDEKTREEALKLLVDYLTETLDVALFIYSGAPSVSHSVKLAKMVAAALGELELQQVSSLEVHHYREHVSREVVAQLSAVRDERSFGAHTLFLLDCLIFLDPKVPEETLRSILTRRGVKVEDLDALGVLTLLRRFSDPRIASDLKDRLLERAKGIIVQGGRNQQHETARAILLLSLPTYPGAWPQAIARTMGPGYSVAKVKSLQSSKFGAQMFSWDASETYYERLLLKSAQFVY